MEQPANTLAALTPNDLATLPVGELRILSKLWQHYGENRDKDNKSEEWHLLHLKLYRLGLLARILQQDAENRAQALLLEAESGVGRLLIEWPESGEPGEWVDLAEPAVDPEEDQGPDVEDVADVELEEDQGPG